VSRPTANERIFRCAIYARKSSEEGLEQDSNSLHAQRESCEAYIKSQGHEGWTVLPTTYDDGGYSGGTLERPALNQLLGHVQSGAVDVVVVYKVDRLTRSFSDFAKIVEVFDKAGASFVSVSGREPAAFSEGSIETRYSAASLSVNGEANFKCTGRSPSIGWHTCFQCGA